MKTSGATRTSNKAYVRQFDGEPEHVEIDLDRKSFEDFGKFGEVRFNYNGMSVRVTVS